MPNATRPSSRLRGRAVKLELENRLAGISKAATTGGLKRRAEVTDASSSSEEENQKSKSGKPPLLSGVASGQGTRIV